MRILFYSESCNFCLKLLEYINKNNLGQYFKMICIDEKTAKIPKHITIVPTVIDTTIESPMEGKRAFEYVINQKYFNHPTNNIEYTKNGIPIPTIEEDMKAGSSKSGNSFIFVDKNKEIDKEEKNNFDQVFNFNQFSPQIKNIQAQDNRVNQLIEQRNIQDKKIQSLMRLQK
jgi:hypothetical protein